MLLMVHQSPRSSAEYTALMQQWAPHFTCIAPDTPGFGQSDALPSGPDINDYADALRDFLGALGVQSCAAYGFHSGGIILVTAVKRHPQLFSTLAIGGYAIWTQAERDLFGSRYLPEWHPSDYGEHLTWLWNRILEQSWFFPWFDIRDEARLSVAHADLSKVNQAVSEMLDAGNNYRAGYGAVLSAPRDIPASDAPVPPCLITAYDGDPLQSHIDRLGEMPANWQAHRVTTPQDHHDTSLAFLQEHADKAPCPELAEDADEGWLAIDGGLIHWRGDRTAASLTLHAPAAEMAQPEPGTMAIDAPGHGHSSAFAVPEAAIRSAAAALGIEAIDWPAAPAGDSDELYPDLTPDRHGAHLLRAWSAARAEAFFEPWYCAAAANAIAVDPTAITPAAIAARAHARIRAADAAKTYHNLLTTLGDQS